MKKIKTLIVLSVFAFIISGCVAPLLVTPVVVGAAGGAGGVYSVKTDSVEDNFNITKDRAFEIMIELIKADNGIITKSSIYDGRIDGELVSSKIYVTIKQINDTQVHMKIEARKNLNLLPDKETAVRLYRQFVKDAGL